MGRHDQPSPPHDFAGIAHIRGNARNAAGHGLAQGIRECLTVRRGEHRKIEAGLESFHVAAFTKQVDPFPTRQRWQDLGKPIIP